MTPGGQILGGSVQIFEDTRPRPIEVRAVVEDHIDEGHAEEGEAAHDMRLRHGQHGGGQRIGDLILDHLRRLARILRVDDDLNVGEIRDGVERHVLDSIDADERDEDGGDADEDDVPRRPADDVCDHGAGLRLVEGLQGGLQVALGIDEEGGGGDHLLAALHAVQHLDIAAAGTAELDLAWLETALALGDEDDLPCAAVDHRARRHGGNRRRLGAWMEEHIGIHAGLDVPLRVRQLDTHRDRPRLQLHHIVDR